MKLDTGYVWEKLNAAVSALVGGSGTLQERLQGSYGGTLEYVEPEQLPDEMPEKLAKDLERIHEAMSNLSVMTDTHARRLALEILSLYDRVARFHGGEEARREAKGAGEQAAPPKKKGKGKK